MNLNGDKALAKLTELPDGSWIELGMINSVRTQDSYAYLDGSKPSVSVGVGAASSFVTLDFETLQAARDYAAVLAKLVNEAATTE